MIHLGIDRHDSCLRSYQREPSPQTGATALLNSDNDKEAICQGGSWSNCKWPVMVSTLCAGKVTVAAGPSPETLAGHVRHCREMAC